MTSCKERSKPLNKINEGLDDVLMQIKTVGEFSAEKLKRERQLVFSINFKEVMEAFLIYTGNLPSPGSVLTSKDLKVVHNLRMVLVGCKTILNERMSKTLRLFGNAVIVQRPKKRISEIREPLPETVEAEVVAALPVVEEVPIDLMLQHTRPEKKRILETQVQNEVQPTTIQDEVLRTSHSGSIRSCTLPLDGGFGAMEGLFEDNDDLRRTVPETTHRTDESGLRPSFTVVPGIVVQQASPDSTFIERLRFFDTLEPPKPPKIKRTVKPKVDKFRAGGTVLSRDRVNKIMSAYNGPVNTDKLKWMFNQPVDPFSSEVLMDTNVYKHWNLRWKEDSSVEEEHELVWQEVKSVKERWAALAGQRLRGISSLNIQVSGREPSVAVATPSNRLPSFHSVEPLPIQEPVVELEYAAPVLAVSQTEIHEIPTVNEVSGATIPRESSRISDDIDPKTISSETSSGIDWDEAKPIFQSLATTWDADSPARVVFVDLLKNRTKLEAARTFKILLGFWGIGAVAMTQDSSDPKEIYVNMGPRWTSMIDEGL